MLTGSTLLTRVRELGSMPRAELVRACGYVSTGQDGSERLNYTAFYEALLEAKGVHFGPPVSRRSQARSADQSRPGRRLTYTTKVHFNGTLMVGSAYTSLLDLRPGDSFQIQIEPPRGDRQRGQIRLLPRVSGRLGPAQGPAVSASDDVPSSPALAASSSNGARSAGAGALGALDR